VVAEDHHPRCVRFAVLVEEATPDDRGYPQRLEVPRCHQLAVAQLDGVARTARQRRQERVQPVSERRGSAHDGAALRRELEDQRAEAGVETADRRREHAVDRRIRVEVAGVRFAAGVRQRRRRALAPCFDEEAEVRRHGGRVARELGLVDRRVERPVDAD